MMSLRLIQISLTPSEFIIVFNFCVLSLIYFRAYYFVQLTLSMIIKLFALITAYGNTSKSKKPREVEQEGAPQKRPCLQPLEEALKGDP